MRKSPRGRFSFPRPIHSPAITPSPHHLPPATTAVPLTITCAIPTGASVGVVASAAHPIVSGSKITDRRVAAADQAAGAQAHPLCRHSGRLVDRIFERQKFQVAHVMAEDSRIGAEARRIVMPVRSQNRVHLEHVERMLHRGPERIFVPKVVAAV